MSAWERDRLKVLDQAERRQLSRSQAARLLGLGGRQVSRGLNPVQ